MDGWKLDTNAKTGVGPDLACRRKGTKNKQKD